MSGPPESALGRILASRGAATLAERTGERLRIHYDPAGLKASGPNTEGLYHWNDNAISLSRQALLGSLGPVPDLTLLHELKHAALRGKALSLRPTPYTPIIIDPAGGTGGYQTFSMEELATHRMEMMLLAGRRGRREGHSSLMLGGLAQQGQRLAIRSEAALSSALRDLESGAALPSLAVKDGRIIASLDVLVDGSPRTVKLQLFPGTEAERYARDAANYNGGRFWHPAYQPELTRQLESSLAWARRHRLGFSAEADRLGTPALVRALLAVDAVLPFAFAAKGDEPERVTYCRWSEEGELVCERSAELR